MYKDKLKAYDKNCLRNFVSEEELENEKADVELKRGEPGQIISKIVLFAKDEKIKMNPHSYLKIFPNTTFAISDCP